MIINTSLQRLRGNDAMGGKGKGGVITAHSLLQFAAVNL